MYVIGLDLGQKQDFTAVSVVQKVEREGEKPLLHLRHLERYPLGTTYGDIADRIVELHASVTGANPRQKHIQGGGGSRAVVTRTVYEGPELIVDATGVGVGVTEMLSERGLRHRPVTITAGTNETRSKGTYHVPKRNLVSRAVAPFEDRRLKIARGMSLVPDLVRELEAFKVKVSTSTAHDSYEAWREKDHDDLVLSLALACWWCERSGGRVRVTAKPAGF